MPGSAAARRWCPPRGARGRSPPPPARWRRRRGRRRGACPSAWCPHGRPGRERPTGGAPPRRCRSPRPRPRRRGPAPAPARCGVPGRRAGPHAVVAAAMEPMSTPCSATTSRWRARPRHQPGQRGRVERARHRRAAEQAATEARALLVGEVHERDGALGAVLGGHAQHLERRPSRRAPRRASRRSGRSRCASRGPRSPPARPARRAQRLPASSTSTLTPSDLASRLCRNARARRATHRSSTPAARRRDRPVAVELAQVRDHPPRIGGHQPTRSRRIACIRQWAPPPPSVNAESSGS